MKAKNPLMSIEARGNYGKAFEFLGGRSGTAIRQYRKRGRGRTARQHSKREDLLIVSRAWADLTDGERASWESYGRLYPKIDSLGNVYYIPGYNAFVGLASKAREQGASPVLTAPSVPRPGPVLGSATEPGLAGQIIVTWDPASGGDNIEMWVAGPLRAGRKAKSTDYRLHSYTPTTAGFKVVEDLEISGLYDIRLRVSQLIGQTGISLEMTEVAGGESIKGYYTMGTDPGRIAVVDLISFLHQETFTLPAGDPWIYPLASDSWGQFLYTVDSGAPCECIKLDRTPLSKVTDIEVAGVDEFGYGSVIDSKNEYLYIASWAPPSKVFKIRLYDFAIEDEANLAAGVGENYGMVIDSNDEFIYMSCHQTTKGVVKIRTSDLVQVGFCAIAGGADLILQLVLDESRGYIYVGVAGAPMNIARIALSTFIYQDKLDTGDAKHRPGVLVPDFGNGLLYAGTSGVPAWVLKINLDTFAVIGELELNAGEQQLQTGLIDLVRGFSYWSTWTIPTTIIKVKNSDLSRVSSIVLPTSDERAEVALSVGS